MHVFVGHETEKVHVMYEAREGVLFSWIMEYWCEVHYYENIVKVLALKLILIDIFENNKWSISSIISKLHSNFLFFKDFIF